MCFNQLHYSTTNEDKQVNASDFTFGVEIETTMPHGSVVTGEHGYGIQVEWLPEGWVADSDPSIIANGRKGCEFVSPVLRGAEGLRQVMQVIKEIRLRGGKVNTSCGLHVHVGYDKTNTAAVGRLINTVAAHEKALYAITGSRGREQGSGSRYSTNWCKSVKQYGNARSAQFAASCDRYHILNIATVKPTVEFRAFYASLNEKKVAAYIRVCIGLVQKSLMTKRSAAFGSVSKGPRARRGDIGQAELCRMLQAIGWWRGLGKGKAFGVLEGEGIPSVEESRDEMWRLAKKYDSAAS